MRFCAATAQKIASHTFSDALLTSTIAKGPIATYPIIIYTELQHFFLGSFRRRQTHQAHVLEGQAPLSFPLHLGLLGT